MSTLQIHITAGPQAGARLQLNQAPVTFGRSADCTLVLDVPVVSRMHGELHLDEQGRWLLTNHSANGTRVGRKKAKKPILLTDGASIIIGDIEIFRVHLDEPSDDTPPAFKEEQEDTAQPVKAAPGAGTKDRSKLWIGLGVWFALCLGGLIFAVTLKGDGEQPDGSNSGAFYYPGRDIEDLSGEEAGLKDIRLLLADKPPREDPDAARYSTYLTKAREFAEQGPSALFDAYDNYQKAIAVSDDPDQPFDEPLDITRYNRILEDLSATIYARYVYAYNSYHSNEYQLARQVLEDLRNKYYRVNDPDDALANHIRKLRNAAHSRAN